MAFQRPTLAELIDRTQADFVSRLELVGAVLRRSVVYVLSRVLAGVAHMLHGHLDFLGRQLFPDLSVDEYLVRQASLYGLAKTSPDFARGTVIVTGTNGTAIPAEEILTRSDGAEYEVDAEVNIATLTAWTAITTYDAGDIRRNGGIVYLCIEGGTSAASGGPTGTDSAITDGTVEWMHIGTGTAAVEADVTAVEAGADQTLSVGVVLSFESPVSGADAVATVSVVLEDGTDEETTEALRTRLLEHMADPANGGTLADYIAWAKTVSGVTRVWPVRLGLGPGTVLVRFVRDDDASIIPDAGEVAEVQAVLDAEAPAHATPTAFAPELYAIDFEVTVVPDTTPVREAVEAELADLIFRRGEPGGTILLSEIRTAIGTAAGLTDYTLTDPVADVTHTPNQIPELGSIAFL